MRIYSWNIIRFDSQKCTDITPPIKGGTINETRKKAIQYLKSHKFYGDIHHGYMAEIHMRHNTSQASLYGCVYYCDGGAWYVSPQSKKNDGDWFICYPVRTDGSIDVSRPNYESI